MTDTISLEATLDTSVQLKIIENTTELEVVVNDNLTTEVRNEVSILEVTVPNDISIDIITDNAQLIVPGTNRITFTLGDTVYSGRAVEVNNQGLAILASSTGSGFGIIGVAVQSGTVGQKIEVVTYGSFTDTSYNLIPDEPLFLRENGIISQSPPSTGVTVVIGSAITPTTMFIRIEQPIYMIDEI